MADRYLTTREAARVLRRTTHRTWQILREHGKVPLAVTCREEDGAGRECVWRAEDVLAVVKARRRSRKPAQHDRSDWRRRANITRGLNNIRRKQEALCQK